MEQRKKAKQRKNTGKPNVSGKCPDVIGTKTGTTAGPEERRLEEKEKERPGGNMDLQFPKHLDTPEALAAAEQWFDYLDRTGLDARSPRGDDISLKHWWQNAGDDFVDSDSMVRAVSFSIAGNYLNLNAKKGTGKRVAEASSDDWLKVRKVIQQYPSRSESDTLKRREHLTKQQQEAVKRTGRENISTMTQFNETRIREVFENHFKDITNGK
jgi:vacuolar-type H+-ATPase subunit H